MIWEETITFRRLLLTYFLSASSMFYAGSACDVHPKDVVAAAGNRVSLNCSATGGLYIGSWQKGADISTKKVVYTAPVYRSDGSIKTPRFVAPGYSVDDQKETQAILHINSVSLSQAGPYYCTCSDAQLTTSSGVVVVIEPKFSTNFSVCSWEPVTIACSISSSENIAYALAIKDAYGKTVARQTNSSLCNEGLTSCQLNYTFTANESVNESFSCTVNVTTSKNIRFSKMLHSSIDYSTDCSGKRESQSSTGEWNNNYWIIIGLPVACGIGIVLAILAFLRTRLRKGNRSGIKQSSCANVIKNSYS